MKLTSKLCGTALLAVAGVAIAAPNTKAVDNLQHDGDAYIEFTRNTEGGSNTTITKPGTTGSTITNIPDVTDPGDFGIVAVTPLDFSSHEVVAGSAATEYFALPFVANEGNADEYLVENFVKFYDGRSTLNRAYKLYAEMTQEFTGQVEGTDVALNGSELTFTNLALTSIEPSHLQPESADLNFGTNSLSYNVAGNKQLMLENTAANKGAGDYELTFGNQDAGTAATSVKLNLKDDIEIFETKYTAKIQWTLEATR
ncbi:WxL domain-containing protein [Enterococcus sp. BWB1-3]|uniref:WxL domain-containing protein n=1 Tax=unclassified Enterococcus TaxID=2608891 RepID=UPI0019211752|nr:MULTISPECIES: WxL domain-containing protein [unclassified Enterococcus]MBL1229471.1 WxL domain-containing protein [Enterococcus sp. BWB1-3]MCB5952645.1 WxL domain-containing protein [Enterococcus sp. BWT-B8]